MLPSNLDGLFPVVSYDDELSWPVVVMAAKCDNVRPGHSGRKMAKTEGRARGEEQKREALSRTLSILRLGQGR